MAEECAGWTDKDGKQVPCQFGDPVPHTHFGGKIYCDYHLPMGSAGGSGKTGWDEERRDAFTADLIGRIKAESTPETEKPEKLSVELDFRGVVVPGEFRLSGETISALNMRYAQFHGPSWFSKAQFHGIAAFSDAQFYLVANFDETQFHEDAYFVEAQFHGPTLFSKARFHDIAGFSEAQFHADADFRETQFHRDTEFDEARFHEYAMFNASADPTQLDARQFNRTSFQQAQFKSGANFSNREFRDRTDFSGCEFGIAPNFHGSVLNQDTAFGGIECFPDVASNGADRAYRTLRQAMETHRARAEEGMFYTLEQKARRQNMRSFSLAFVMSLCYGLGSNYGFSVIRPLVALVVGIFTSAFLLLCVGVFAGKGAGGDLAPMWSDGLLFSARQLFLPFDALRSADKILTDYAFNPGGTGWLRAWGVVLTLFEALAALLLVLAVRWRYRR